MISSCFTLCSAAIYSIVTVVSSFISAAVGYPKDARTPNEYYAQAVHSAEYETLCEQERHRVHSVGHG